MNEQRKRTTSWIRIRGCSEHNLRHVSVDIPRSALTVITGVSGSGKSSLAFDSIFREGQRRFLESLPAYARRFLGGVDKPDLEHIEGLSPAIAIDQRTISRNPRSTVGTMTEIHDHLRLLFARLGQPHCAECGIALDTRSAEEITSKILRLYEGESVMVCAPVSEAPGRTSADLRAGQLEELRSAGFRRLIIDGQLVRLDSDNHSPLQGTTGDVSIVFDRLRVAPAARSRLTESIEKCLEIASGVVELVTWETGSADQERVAHGRSEQKNVSALDTFSSLASCPRCRTAQPSLEPRLFSFNSPHGMCDLCEGLGWVDAVDPDLVIANPNLPFVRGGVDFVTRRGKFLHSELDGEGFLALGEKYGFGLESSWADLSPEAQRAVLRGEGDFRGWMHALEDVIDTRDSAWAKSYVRQVTCPNCRGSRLCAAARAVVLEGRTIDELSTLPVGALRVWLEEISFDAQSDAAVAQPIQAALLSRLRYLEHVGLGYLSLSRSAATLSGGEGQRIRLASQVGAGLRGVLYVLDEPSIGLHTRDHARLLETLRHLRDQDNTVVVVEHDADTMETADYLIDVGPGAGRFGGEIVAAGTVNDLIAEPKSLTGSYLSRRRTIEVPDVRRGAAERFLELYGVEHNNLKNIDVRFPLERLVAVTGVSGSGKSSLINQVLYPALRRHLGYRHAAPGAFRSLKGAQEIDKLVVIDQSPIGRSPRSNPATYVKAFDEIRSLFAKVPEARMRGYSPGRFSFNKSEGRCLDCEGAGVKIIEMQFLAPVEVVCDVCGGRRYNRETLEIRYRGQTIFDVLSMTVSQAHEFFSDHPKIARSISQLERVGLGYVALGQPATTLSGGEAQRVKLAAELRRRDTGRTLYILDEPTVGLHFEDISKLVKALQDLVDRGNTAIVIEHNLDVIKVVDHVIDLGPEAGGEGGELVAEGTPEEIAHAGESPTAAALRTLFGDGEGDGRRVAAKPRVSRDDDGRRAGGGQGSICLRGGRLHNLKAIDVDLPHDQLIVVTGVSGSGKTSLAIDTIFAEGQRRYVECLSTYARHFLGQAPAPPVDSLSGLAPSIAIDQHNSSGNPRSTVATVTEVYDYLRILFARVGEPHCPHCEVPLDWTTPSRLASEIVPTRGGARLYVLAPQTIPMAPSRSGIPQVSDVETFCSSLLKGGLTRLWIGEELRLDEASDVSVRRLLSFLRERADAVETTEDGEPESQVHVIVDRLIVDVKHQTRLAASLESAFGWGSGEACLMVAGEEIERYFRRPSCSRCGFSLTAELSPRMFSFNSHQGACTRCGGLGLEDRVDVGMLFVDPRHKLQEATDPVFLEFLRTSRPSVWKALRELLKVRHLEDSPLREWGDGDKRAVLFGDDVPVVRVPLENGVTVDVAWEGLASCLERGAQLETLGADAPKLQHLFHQETCSVCRGGRLRPEILAVQLGGLNVHGVTALTIADALEFVRRLELTPVRASVADQVLSELQHRLEFLVDVGLGYITLDREARTLSGGEAQRIRLASQLGHRLAGVIYVLDEPTVGLHPADTERLITTLFQLRDLGNTVLVVEHDRDCIAAADLVIELGPGAGRGGGEVTFHGPPDALVTSETSVTGPFISGRREAFRLRERSSPEQWIRLRGVRRRNLKNVEVSLPLQRLVAVSGVSGSGKSTLVFDVLAPVARRLVARSLGTLDGVVDEVEGGEQLRRVVQVDQRPLGRSLRSNAATYSGLWDHVRELYSQLQTSKVRGYGPGRFSFNIAEGRCSACDGQGARLVEMHFLSDIWVPCETCRGKRFNSETLSVEFKGKTVGDVLDMEVDEALEFFENQPRIQSILQSLQDVGLGYLRLGQPAKMLSGGEAQRVKIATELAARNSGDVLYILDEPTTGLHLEDVARLLDVFQRLVDQGNTVVVIEHHLDVLRSADWLIDLGPGAGEEGGEVVASCPPTEIGTVASSATARFLAAESAGRSSLCHQRGGAER